VAREVRVETVNAGGAGERWTASWRWWEGRPRAAFELAAPRLWRARGLWRIEGVWERQTYLVAPPHGGDAGVAASERRRATVSFGDWASGNARWEVRGGWDDWATRGSHASAGAIVERRWLADRVSVRGEGTFWRPIGRAAAFGSSSVSAAWRSTPEPGSPWLASAGVYGVSRRAPLDVWPTADTGQVGPQLLRAHPLLQDGAIPTSDASPVLAHVTVERQQPIALPMPVRVWWAAFVDAARRGAFGDHRAGATLIDAGVGLRLQLPGAARVLRLDVARGLRDGGFAFSAGWQVAWSGR
jgi:hypothetical protein